MNAKPYIFLIITSALFAAIGCKKSSDPVAPAIVFSGIYQASNTINLSSVFMYTMNGRVTNQDLIKAYLERHSVYDHNQFPFTTAITEDNSAAQVNFTDSGRVKLSKALDNSYPATEYTITQRTAGGFILEAVDTSIYVGSTNDVSRSSILINEAGNLQKSTNCRPFGPTETCNFRNAYQFIIKDGQLYYCLFSCIINTNFENISFSSYYISNYSGSFNMGLLKQLTTGDTVVYQSKTILFKKN